MHSGGFHEVSWIIEDVYGREFWGSTLREFWGTTSSQVLAIALPCVLKYTHVPRAYRDPYILPRCSVKSLCGLPDELHEEVRIKTGMSQDPHGNPPTSCSDEGWVEDSGRVQTKMLLMTVASTKEREAAT